MHCPFHKREPLESPCRITLRLGANVGLLSLTVRLGCVLAVLDDQVSRVLRLALDEVLDDLLGAVGVSLLGVQGGTGVLLGVSKHLGSETETYSEQSFHYLPQVG